MLPGDRHGSFEFSRVKKSLWWPWPKVVSGWTEARRVKTILVKRITLLAELNRTTRSSRGNE